MYADDLSLIASSPEGLQSMLDTVKLMPGDGDIRSAQTSQPPYGVW